MEDEGLTQEPGSPGQSSPSGPTPPVQPFRRETKLPVNPRRVRGGVRLKRKEGGPESWAGQRIWRVVEQGADGDALREGLDYARQGQTRRISFEGGRVEASVQGRRTKAYVTTFALPRFSAEDAARAVRALGEQSRFAAKLLSGEMPASIEDAFIPIGLHVFPTGADEVEISCTCTETKPWCKHAICVAALFAERVGEDPFLILELRGLSREELLEGLREHRSMGMETRGPQAVYSAHVPGLSDAEWPSLEDEVVHFWRKPGAGEVPGVPVAPAEVSHPLLRRLGPSPFPESRFPLVGLLATCYDLIGRRMLDLEEGETDPEVEARDRED